MEGTVLFVNACVRKESRTMKLAEKLLHLYGADPDAILKDAEDSLSV